MTTTNEGADRGGVRKRTGRCGGGRSGGGGGSGGGSSGAVVEAAAQQRRRGGGSGSKRSVSGVGRANPLWPRVPFERVVATGVFVVHALQGVRYSFGGVIKRRRAG